MAGWTTADMPDLTGKIAVITGASDGLGLETARALALKGADVILAVRSMKKGGEALEKIKKDVPNADVKLKELDLSNLQSVNVFAESMCDAYGSLDLLINNAGVMMPPYKKTTDGFELQFGVNHLGHFALTGQLMPIIQAAENPRIVTLSSLAAHKASIDFDNLDGVTGYRAYTFYAQSKFANLLFAVKLQNKLKNEAAHVKSFVCHPGLSQSNLLSRGGGARGKGFLPFLQNHLAQSVQMGALPTLYAATEPTLRGGEYVGPDHKNRRKGYPKVDPSVKDIYDEATADRLWVCSEELTGVKFFEGKTSASV